MIEEKNLKINIVLIGEISEYIKSEHFYVTGRYEREALPQLIKEHEIDIFLLPSICPETFSYTTQEIMMMDMPLMVFDLGAPAERIIDYNKGYIVDKVSSEAVLETIQQFQASKGH
jgi:glycosyltransferase involved in cell wall biosynthesis